MNNNIQNLLNIVGNKNKYQFYVLIMLLNTGLLSGICNLQISFLIKYPSFIIYDKQNNNEIISDYNHKYCNQSQYIMTKIYNTSLHNLAYSFDIYCKNDFYSSILKMNIFIGGLISYILFTSYPDKNGREKIYKIFSILSLLLQINLFFEINVIYSCFVYLFGGFVAFSYSMCFSIAAEFFNDNIRGIVVGLLNSFYPLGGVLIGIFFMTINNWKILYLITTILHIIPTYITLKYFLESPKWLISVGKKNEFIYCLNKIAKINGKDKEWEEYKSKNKDFLNNITKKDNLLNKNNNILYKNYNILEILSFKSQRNKFLKILFISSVTIFNYYGIILNLSMFKGNFFANTIFAFIGEMIFEFYSGYLADIYGRLPIIKLGGYLGSIGFLIFKFIPNKFKSIFLFVTMSGFASQYNVSTIYAPEIFPTKIRATCVGFLFLLNRLPPFLMIFLTLIMENNVEYVSIILSFLAGYICNYLEETANKPINEEIPEEHNFNENFNDNVYSNDSLKFSLLEFDVISLKSYH